VIPLLALQPVGKYHLIGNLGRVGSLNPLCGIHVSSNPLTTDSIAYQLKGHWHNYDDFDSLRVEEIYSN